MSINIIHIIELRRIFMKYHMASLKASTSDALPMMETLISVTDMAQRFIHGEFQYKRALLLGTLQLMINSKCL